MTTQEQKYRICFRIYSGETRRCTDLFTRAEAEAWVNNLNNDRDNKAAGLYHWMETVDEGEAVAEAAATAGE